MQAEKVHIVLRKQACMNSCVYACSDFDCECDVVSALTSSQ